MNHTHTLKETDRAHIPALPRLAEKAAHDLARPTKTAMDGLRAIDAWFGQHGDPFSAMPPAAFAAQVQIHQNVFDGSSDALSNAEIIARLRSTYTALQTRLQQAARTEREE